MERARPVQTAGNYWPTVLLVLLATCPGLINGTGLSLATVSIARDLGVAPADVSWVSIMGNAGLGIGVVFAADLTQRISSQRLLIWCLALFTFGSIVAAFAPSLPILIAARIVQGLGSGLLLITAVPPLVTGFPPSRLGSTFTVLVMAFFGIATAGPLIGGVTQQHDLWRWLFGVNAGFGVLSIFLTPRLIARLPAPNPHLRVDGPALALTVASPILAFFGCAQLSWHEWADWQVYLPLALGIALFVVLLIVELAQEEPLMPIRFLARPISLGAVVIAIAAGTVFTGTLGIVPIFLERVQVMSPQNTGLTFWPGLLAATVAAIAVGISAGKSWQPVFILLGMICLGAGAWGLAGIDAGSGKPYVQVLIAVLGLGAGLTVAPAMFLASFSVPPALVSRALAMVSLVRLAVGFVAAVPLTHAVTTIAAARYATLHSSLEAAPRLLRARLDPLVQAEIAGGAQPGQARSLGLGALHGELQRQALLSGLHDIFLAVLWLTVAGTVAGVGLFGFGTVRARDRKIAAAAPIPGSSTAAAVADARALPESSGAPARQPSPGAVTAGEAGPFRIAVPLDGSPLAERAIPYAREIAEALNATLLLASVVDGTPEPGFSPLPTTLRENEQRAVQLQRVDYLSQQRDRLAAEGFQAESHLLDSCGDISGTLLAFETEAAVRLVVVGTHGRAGFTRWTLGSVTERLLHYGRVPMLLIRSHAPTSSLRHALLPLDGSKAAEAVLQVLHVLDGRLIQDCTLLTVVARPDLSDGAREYLEGVAAGLEAGGLRCSYLVCVGDPADQIIDAAGDRTMTMMTTHGHTHLTDWAMGTTAARVVRHGAAPVLLLRT